MSKTKLSHIYPGVSTYCDKCKIAEASLIHMYWSCPCLGKYWTEVFHTLSTILNTCIDANPLVALFGVTDDQVTLPSFKRQALSFCSLLARHAVLLKWRDSAPPNHTQWLHDLTSSLKLEKIRNLLQRTTAKFMVYYGALYKMHSRIFKVI